MMLILKRDALQLSQRGWKTAHKGLNPKGPGKKDKILEGTVWEKCSFPDLLLWVYIPHLCCAGLIPCSALGYLIPLCRPHPDPSRNLSLGHSFNSHWELLLAHPPTLLSALPVSSPVTSHPCEQFLRMCLFLDLIHQWSSSCLQVPALRCGKYTDRGWKLARWAPRHRHTRSSQTLLTPKITALLWSLSSTIQDFLKIYYFF